MQCSQPTGTLDNAKLEKIIWVTDNKNILHHLEPAVGDAKI
jgi:hypothetical protein